MRYTQIDHVLPLEIHPSQHITPNSPLKCYWFSVMTLIWPCVNTNSTLKSNSYFWFRYLVEFRIDFKVKLSTNTNQRCFHLTKLNMFSTVNSCWFQSQVNTNSTCFHRTKRNRFSTVNSCWFQSQVFNKMVDDQIILKHSNINHRK